MRPQSERYSESTASSVAETMPDYRKSLRLLSIRGSAVRLTVTPHWEIR